MAPFLRNISFHSVNMVALLQRALPICAQVFQEVMGMLSEGITKPVDPMVFMPFSKIEEGFRTMQIGKHIGKIVFEAHDEDLVPVSNHQSSMLHPTDFSRLCRLSTNG